MTTKIFVGNLSWHTDERTLKNVFASAGPVKFVKVVRDRSTSVSKGFAFVTFKEADAVPVAVEQFDKFVVDGKPIQVTVAEEKEKDKDAKKAEGDSVPAGAAAPDSSASEGQDGTAEPLEQASASAPKPSEEKPSES